MRTIIFNKKDVYDFGIYILSGNMWDSPERDVTYYEIPGRSGDLSIDNGRYKNMDVSYDAVIMHDFDQMFDSFRVFMTSQKGYHRLEDTVHPDEYRMAEFTGPVKPNVAPFNKAGKFVIKFRCKPQRYLKSGEKVTPETTFTSAGQIYNPTPFESKPVLRVYGTGQFGIGNQSIRITSANQYTDFDCELKDAFKGTTNCNGNIQLLSGDFPVIKPGVVGISLGSGITKIEITPRWFLL